MNPASLFTRANNKFGSLSVEVRRYLVVGLSVYLFELLVIVIAQRLGASSVVAVGLSFWLGLIVSFIIQKFLTFGDNRVHYRILIPQLIAFSLLVLFNFGFTLLVTKLLSDVIPAMICRTIALGITVIWNFYLYKTRIFHRQVEQTSRVSTARVTKATKIETNPSRGIRAVVAKPWFGAAYLLNSIVVLLATTILWSMRGAQLQQTNADQLANAYLFETARAWHGGLLPDQHSFLIKWPLFYLVKVFEYTDTSFIVLTVATVAATVGLFVWVLSRIERRPIMLGMLCLALSSVLLLVPAQPYAGGLLPVNMAMMTTRNLEYMLYIFGVYWVIKAPHTRSWQWLSAAGLLGLLIASDKLFLSISLGGALLTLVVYSARRQWTWVSLAVRWLFVSLAAIALSVLILGVLNATHVTKLVGQDIAGPYGAIHDPKSLALGSIYAVTGVLTNLGANPAFDALTVGTMPGRIAHYLASLNGPAFIANFIIAVWAIVVALRLLLASLQLRPNTRFNLESTPGRLAVCMLWTTVAAIGLFVVADHYYVVDARYLTISLFSLFIGLAAWSATKSLARAEVLVGLTGVLVISIGSGYIGMSRIHTQQVQALKPLNDRNVQIVQTLQSHRTKTLVGDYWRVLPIKNLSHNRQEVTPMAGCTTPRGVLTSKEWQPDLRHQPFTYLLTLEGSMTDAPNCSLQQVTAYYGLPNSSALIAGTLAHPKELLLFYDNGIHLRTPNPITSATVLPIGLDELMRTTCPVPTIMNIVAHQDDDLLFMNPDLLHDIREGHCVRSIYLTAGDAGSSAPYWLSREQGSQAAYSEMLGGPQIWISRIIKLPGGQFISIASPKGNPRISLIFLHLPDGNVHGEGFKNSHYETLAGLLGGNLNQMHTVDHQSSYNSEQLIAALSALMHTYQPSQVRTQSNYPGSTFPDHSDHRSAGQFATKAYERYEIEQYGDGPDQVRIPIDHYLGYPVHESEANISGQDYTDKFAAFMAYAKFDGSVCHSAADCQRNPAYGAYLNRQYASPE